MAKTECGNRAQEIFSRLRDFELLQHKKEPAYFDPPSLEEATARQARIHGIYLKRTPVRELRE